MRQPKLRFARDAWRAVFFESRGDGTYKERMETLRDAAGKPYAKNKRSQAMRALADLERRRASLHASALRITVQTLLENFLAARGPSIRPRSLVIYQTAVRDFCKAFGALSATDVTAATIERYKASLLAREYAARSVNNYLRPLRAAWRWAVETRQVEHTPFLGVRDVRTTAAHGKPPTWEWIEADLLPSLKDPRLSIAIRLAAYAGLRLGEIVHLEWAHVDAGASVIRIESTGGWETKSGKSRLVPIVPMLAGALSDAEALGKKRVAGFDSSGRLQGVWLEERKGKLPHITLHEFRGTYATEMLQRLPPAVVQVLLGHANIQTTMRYYAHVSTSEAIRAAQAVFPVLFPNPDPI